MLRNESKVRRSAKEGCDPLEGTKKKCEIARRVAGRDVLLGNSHAMPRGKFNRSARSDAAFKVEMQFSFGQRVNQKANIVLRTRPNAAECSSWISEIGRVCHGAGIYCCGRFGLPALIHDVSQ